VAAGARHTLARKTDGTLWSWGGGLRGVLGDNDNEENNRSSPIQVPGNQWNDVAAGGFSSRARKTDGTLWSWGFNQNGQIGDNTTIPRSSPVQVPGTSWIDISVNTGQSILARKSL
jgi:alpha-tubulin suppressor-like RCC1 family protein